jgi:hypothetical protein
MAKEGRCKVKTKTRLLVKASDVTERPRSRSDRGSSTNQSRHLGARWIWIRLIAMVFFGGPGSSRGHEARCSRQQGDDLHPLRAMGQSRRGLVFIGMVVLLQFHLCNTGV